MAVAPKASAPLTEIGYSNGVSGWWGTNLDDPNETPELRWPLSIRVYNAMRRQDAQVASVLRAVTMPVRRTKWRIDAGDARPEVAQLVAEDLGLPLVGGSPLPTQPRTRDRFSWSEHLYHALLMCSFGHMFFEQLYRIDPVTKLARLRKLAPRMPMTISKIDVAADGGLVSITQVPATGQTGPAEAIPVTQLVAYVLDQEGGSWTGNSLLRPAYKHWLLKDRLLRVDVQTIERNGMGIPTYTGHDGATADDLAKGRAIAQAWRSGDGAGAAIPFGAKMGLLGVEGTLPQALPSINYHDAQIGRAVLAHFLNLGTQTGSWALGTTFADFFTMSLQALAETVADVANQHIVEDLIDVNWGSDEPAPRLVFDEIGSRHDSTSAAIQQLVSVGALRVDRPLEDYLRSSFGLPDADPSKALPPPPVDTQELKAEMDPAAGDPPAMGDSSPSVGAP